VTKNTVLVLAKTTTTTAESPMPPEMIAVSMISNKKLMPDFATSDAHKYYGGM
jgi:hypothetical protein